jgi:uncharacterized membrane protein
MKKQTRDDIVARADEAFGNRGYAEFSAAKKAQGKYKLARLGMIAAYILIIGALTVFFAIKFVPAVAIMPILGWMLVYFTWRYVSVEYKYIIDHSVFTVYAVYGGKTEKKLVSYKIKEIEKVEPAENEDAIRNFTEKSEVFIDARPDVDSPDIYIADGTDEGGRKVTTAFEASNGIIKAFAFYNSAAVIKKELSR